ncbi:MAG TPA: LysE family transporter [Marmoricola sp.]|nr:LysE family transporter [Marmoricola sp.]
MSGDWWDALLLGATLGVAAGVSPGPLLFWTITTALRSGPRAGVVVACAPLVSDAVVVTTTLLLLGQLSSEVLAVVGVVGGVLMVALGVHTWLEARTASLHSEEAEPGPLLRTLRTAVLLNLVSPHPWVAWATALGPLTIATWRSDPAGGVALVVAFYGLLVGAKVVVALLVARGRHRLTEGGYRVTVRVAGVLLAAAGAVMAVQFALAA